MQYDIILSYSSKDRRTVERVSAYLEHYNINCFVAHRDIPADVAWANGIAAAIKDSRLALVVYSDSYNNAVWMEDELRAISEAGIPALVMCLTSAPYSEGKARYLKNSSCIDATDGTENGFVTLYEEICNMLGMPIDLVSPPSEVLPDDEPVAERQSKTEAPAPKDKITASRVSAKRNGESHQLMLAVVIGVVLTSLVVLFLELILG